MSGGHKQNTQYETVTVEIGVGIGIFQTPTWKTDLPARSCANIDILIIPPIGICCQHRCRSRIVQAKFSIVPGSLLLHAGTMVNRKADYVRAIMN
jgi:hypothetical protein